MITRFAPSPTGPLHLGHAFSALCAFDMVQAAGGTFLLRIEDIDQSRAKPEWEQQIYDDLAWLGLSWPLPVLRQSDNLATYRDGLDRLAALGLLYPCSCTRQDIKQAASAPQEGAPMFGPDGLIYPGTCRGREFSERKETDALRLDMAKAVAFLEQGELVYYETGDGTRQKIRLDTARLSETVGDIVLARRDMGTSYHLSVVLDDAAQEITHVVRGADLAEATQIHVLLQHLLGLPIPEYHHHRLIRDEAGKRLAKRDDARAIAKYRAEGATPADIRTIVGL
ncbi:tRNA glutamyl-Q(34) synthetase GluQRS [Halocynthiibacter sp. C4]|uniref:tRNA glutamyl-Q(34) synthetase GluQRS n=1 Tax=Halocynthiibacter sp. C4 TaxID=2992758 RepID=UPI00237C282E|nr:tRNA glutamyl-Q(34) synthetase GluQRS [Halocynthiibacter sp. C4]MDE0589631.1 tRNA glutamyl-Q(34) synthetase GluQRS [Halocynthiibacter sp. C4]